MIGLERNRGFARLSRHAWIVTVRLCTPYLGVGDMNFSHPLARAARVWQANVGGPRKVLIVVTTLELDPHREGYKKKLVEGLSSAVDEFVVASDDLDGYCLINRPREWNR